MAVGDWVLSIDGENAGSLTHIEAQNKIRACGERLSLGLSRYAGGHAWVQVGMHGCVGACGGDPRGPSPLSCFPSSPGPSQFRANHRR